MSQNPSLLEMLRRRASQLAVRDPSPIRPDAPEGGASSVSSPDLRPAGGRSADAGKGDYRFDETLSFRMAKERAMSHWERWYIAELVARHGGNLSRAARAARMDRKYLRSLVLRYAVK